MTVFMWFNVGKKDLLSAAFYVGNERFIVRSFLVVGETVKLLKCDVAMEKYHTQRTSTEFIFFNKVLVVASCNVMNTAPCVFIS